jgi:hypothetical protein
VKRDDAVVPTGSMLDPATSLAGMRACLHHVTHAWAAVDRQHPAARQIPRWMGGTATGEGLLLLQGAPPRKRYERRGESRAAREKLPKTAVVPRTAVMTILRTTRKHITHTVTLHNVLGERVPMSERATGAVRTLRHEQCETVFVGHRTWLVELTRG